MAWVNVENIVTEKKKAIIAVDFDATIVKDSYPGIGEDNPGAVEVLKELIDNGYRLILFTIRDGNKLEEAIRYCNQKQIDFWGINENPEQEQWSSSDKVFAHIYIDDRGMGVPLTSDGEDSKPYVNWEEVRNILTSWGVLTPKQTTEEESEEQKEPISEPSADEEEHIDSIRNRE